MNYYYRYGDIPTDEQSRIWNGEGYVGKENGVSVYEAHLNEEGEYVPVIPTPLTLDGLDDFYYHLRYYRGKKYIVTGDKIGKGSDNEPLLKNVKIIKEL